MKFKDLKMFIHWDDVHEFDFTHFSDTLELNWEDIVKISKHVDWNSFSKNPNLTEADLELCYPFLKWNLVTIYNRNFTLDFIRNHLTAFHKSWDEISRYVTLDEYFMREFSNLLNWKIVSRYQVMSSDFIIKNRSRVDWNNVEKYQNVPADFVEKNRTVEWE